MNIDHSKKSEFKNSRPFNHLIIDDFFDRELAIKLSEEFPDYDDKLWHLYDNPIEFKKTCNVWNFFPKHTYQVFSKLNSDGFVKQLELLTDDKLYADHGLHGGGWHLHSRGGKLNVHLDYNLHPKLEKKQRKLNIIIYLTLNWDSAWGGGLELWSHDHESNQPKECVVKVENKFNRAVIFDTTQNSWHGLPDPLNCPENVYRKSLAAYYLRDADEDAVNRQRALFAPHGAQANDASVLEIIKNRSDQNNYANSYIKK